MDLPEVGWTRKYRDSGRLFIQHQLEIMDFNVLAQGVQSDVRGVQFLGPDELIADFPARFGKKIPCVCKPKCHLREGASPDVQMR
jgi:hypothetical protein